uniref:Uncharacterized protein n=1 Tax=Yersinia enterocolitica W22703 TaxID=913028 RepID=F4MZX9_YEREN|nr:unknown protein [Yersinia enterocolitica W22703]
MAKQVRPQVRDFREPPGHLARRDDRNSLGGFHHGSGAIAPIKKPDIWLQYLSAIFKKNTWFIGSVHIWRGTSLHGCIDGVFTICLFSP